MLTVQGWNAEYGIRDQSEASTVLSSDKASEHDRVFSSDKLSLHVTGTLPH